MSTTKNAASWPQSAAIQHVVHNIPRAREHDTVGMILDHLRSGNGRPYEKVYIVDDDRKLIGSIPLVSLLQFRPEIEARELLRKEHHAVQATMDQEHVAGLALTHRLTSIPVVDRENRLLGEIQGASLMDILRREHVEDIHRFAGIRSEAALIESSINGTTMHRVRDRLPWLLLGLLGSGTATLVMARFEEDLKANITLSFFVPAIVYLADAVGTQTEAIIVRALSLSRTPTADILGGEVRTGILIGSSLGAIAWIAIVLLLRDYRLAFVIGLSILTAGTMATVLGLFFPWALQKIGLDPAYGSGPVATVVQDILSILIYLGMAQWVYGL